MISRSKSTMGHLRSKIRSQEPKIEKLVNTLLAAVLIQYSENLSGRLF
jgi:hypothetical protein